MFVVDVKILPSVQAITAPVQHCDSSVFPGDSDWYSVFESHVLDGPANVCLAQGLSGCGEETARVLLPLVRTRSKWGGVSLSSMQNYYTTDFRPLCSTIAARDLLEPTLASVVHDETADMIHLSPLDADAPETAILKNGLEALGWRVYSSSCQVNWIHDFIGTFEQYISSLPGSLKSTLKRRGSKLMRLSDVSISVDDGSENLPEVLQCYNTVYDRSWKASEPYASFIPALIASMAEKGELRLGLVKIAERPIAVHFWIVKHRHAYIYKLAHDPKYDEYSPGTVLMSRMVKHVMENDRVTRLDFMSGDDKYKQDWMSERREKLSIVAYNPRSWQGRIAHAFDRRIKPFVRSVIH